MHIDEGVVVDGPVDLTRWRPVSRLGYFDYATVESVFEIVRPKWSQRVSSRH